MKCILIIILSLITTSASTTKIVHSMETINKNINIRPNIFDDEPLTKESLKYFLRVINIPCANIVYRQILLESAHLQSANTIKHNNLTGMKAVRKRNTTQIGKSPNGYGIYRTWKDCILDYALWQKAKGVTDDYTEDQYLKLLKKKAYSESKAYIKVIRKMTNYSVA